MLTDITGQEFTFLTVKNGFCDTENDYQCKVICKCGKELFAWYSELSSGTRKACKDRKCKYRKEALFPERLKPGQIINNKITIEGIEWNYTEAKNTYHIVCSCGTRKSITGDYDRLTDLKSCGCLNGQVRIVGYNDIRGAYWTSIKRGAKSRNLIFDLNIKDCWKLYLDQNKKCKLTHVPINLEPVHKFRGRQTASLDRIDSKQGYYLENVQWVHKILNQMKMDLPDNEFRYWCELVTINNKRKENELYTSSNCGSDSSFTSR